MFEATVPFEPSVPIIRPGKGISSFLITCPQMCGFDTHWFSSTYICPGQQCAACEAGHVRKSMIFLSAIRANGEKCILELSMANYNQLSHWEDQPGLCGIVLDVQRDRERGPMRLEIRDGEKKVVTPVERETIADWCCRIHALPRRRDFKEDSTWWEAITQKANSKLYNAMRNLATFDIK